MHKEPCYFLLNYCAQITKILTYSILFYTTSCLQEIATDLLEQSHKSSFDAVMAEHVLVLSV